MKKILVATAALALLGAPAAFAQQGQPDQNGRHGNGGAGGQSQAPQRPAAPARQASQPGPRPDWNAYLKNNPDLQRDYQGNHARDPRYAETPQAYAERHYREHGQAEGRVVPQQSSAPPGGQQNGGRDGRPQGRGNGQPWTGDRGQGPEGLRNGDRRDLRQYERNSNAQHRFRFGGYERPRGWYPRRWTFGEFLPQLFWSQNYWLNDFSDFGLPYPPPGCVWVRDGDDALLIDRYSGEIVQVVYGLFY